MRLTQLTVAFALVFAAGALVLIVGHSDCCGALLERDALATYAHSLQSAPYAPLIIVMGFIIGSIILLPITGLIVVSALALSPGVSLITSMTGIVLAGPIGFSLGRILGAKRLRSRFGGFVASIENRLSRHPLLSVIIVRHLPLGPFSVVNMALGASPITLRDFTLGNIISFTPTLIMASLAKEVLDSRVLTSPLRIVLGVAAAVTTPAILLLIQRRDRLQQ